MKDFLNIVLTQNYLNFVGKMYHQIQGTALGTKMAQAYANIFVRELEEKLLINYYTTSIVWKIYIDVFCVWPGPVQDLKKFINYLNRQHQSIKFTYDCSLTSVDFLDITIYKGPRYSRPTVLDVKPFFKNTNKFQYLAYSSLHPRNNFHSLVNAFQLDH